MHLDSRAGEDLRRIIGQLTGQAPRVATDDDTLVADRRISRDQRIGDAAGHLAHQLAVHAARAGAEHPAESRGAEFEALRESFGECIEVVGVQGPLELFACRRIGIVSEPFAGGRPEFIGGHRGSSEVWGQTS